MEPVGFAYRLDVHDGCVVSVMNGHRMILISIFSLSVLTATCPGGPGLPGTRMSPFWIIGARMTEVVVTTGAARHAKLQSNRHHQTNTQLFRGQMPSCRPTNSVKSKN